MKIREGRAMGRLAVLRSGMCVLAAFLAGCRFSAPEVHLVPAEFQGDVYIIPRMPNGSAPEREGRAILFRMPATGILVTQDAPSFPALQPTPPTPS